MVSLVTAMAPQIASIQVDPTVVDSDTGNVEFHAIDTAVGNDAVDPRGANVDGAALEAGRREVLPTTESTVRFARTKLVVLGCDIADRWSRECRSYLLHLVKTKVSSDPSYLRDRARQAWRVRWSAWPACLRMPGTRGSLIERERERERQVLERLRAGSHHSNNTKLPLRLGTIRRAVQRNRPRCEVGTS